jgi:hypothetical protein
MNLPDVSSMGRAAEGRPVEATMKSTNLFEPSFYTSTVSGVASKCLFDGEPPWK